MTSVKKHINVLITDGEIKFALPVIRCLSKHKNVRIHLVSKYKWVETKFSRYISSFSYYPKETINYASDWVQIINEEIIKKEIDVIFPVNVTEIRLLSEFKDTLLLPTPLLLPSIESFDIAHNKWRLFEFLDQNSISKPHTIHFKSIDKDTSDTLKFPVLSKPLDNSGGIGIERIDTLSSLRAARSEHTDRIIQEYIEGYDIDMSVMCKDGKVLAYTIQKGYWQNLEPYSMPYGVEFIKNKKVFETVKTLMEKLKWSGLAHIDLRYDKINNDFKVIEINPRIWGSINLSNCVGVNFPYLYCLASIGTEFDVPNYRLEKCLNSYGVFKIIKAKIIRKKIPHKIPKNITIYSKLRDPMPSFYKYLVVKLKNKKLFNKKYLQKFKHDVYCNFDTVLK